MQARGSRIGWINVRPRPEDPFDTLIKHNQELLEWAAEIRKESRHRRARCREALRNALTAYENALERQRRWSRHNQRTAR